MSKLGLGNGKFDVSATNSQRGQFLTAQDLPHTIFLRYSHSLSDFTGKPLEKGAPPDLPLPHYESRPCEGRASVSGARIAED